MSGSFNTDGIFKKHALKVVEAQLHQAEQAKGRNHPEVVAIKEERDRVAANVSKGASAAASASQGAVQHDSDDSSSSDNTVMYDTAEMQDVVVKEEPVDESEMDTEVLGTVHVMPTCYLRLRRIRFSTSEEGEDVADIGGGNTGVISYDTMANSESVFETKQWPTKSLDQCVEEREVCYIEDRKAVLSTDWTMRFQPFMFTSEYVLESTQERVFKATKKRNNIVRALELAEERHDRARNVLHNIMAQQREAVMTTLAFAHADNMFGGGEASRVVSVCDGPSK